MTERIDIPAREVHVVRVLDVADDPDAPIAHADVLAALGAEGDLRSDEIELFDIADLGDMPMSTYLAEGHGIAEAELSPMRGRLDGLTGRVLILPSRAFGGEAMTLRVGAPLRVVGRFEEDVPPAQFDTLPSEGARGSGTSPAGGSQPGMRRAALVLLALLVAVAGLVLVLVGGS
ncbi:hypothetical protein [Roseovarius sp. D22-M7]|uniref:hypothetical protein n=1 Tax=Roseovarius sp. D22-M7 TaxID=3127116 RepID=UPI00300F8E09